MPEKKKSSTKTPAKKLKSAAQASAEEKAYPENKSEKVSGSTASEHETASQMEVSVNQESGTDTPNDDDKKKKRICVEQVEKLLAEKEKVTPPVVRSGFSTRSIMIDMIIALMPCIIAAVYFFGYRVSVILFICTGLSALFEFLWCRLLNKPNSVGDLSCIVSGIILALSLPAGVPLWIPVLGTFFMVVFVKMCFGGLGQNFMNPAAAAKAFLMVMFPVYMLSFTAPSEELKLIDNIGAAQAVTPIAALEYAEGVGDMFSKLPGYLELYFGNVPGGVGETSVFAVLIGGIYLIFRRVLNWEIPALCFVVFSMLNFIFGHDVMYQLLAGGVVFSGVFMATDYTTSPVTRRGRVVYGVLLGVTAYLVRHHGGYPEGMCFAVIFCNVLSGFIDRVSSTKNA